MSFGGFRGPFRRPCPAALPRSVPRKTLGGRNGIRREPSRTPPPATTAAPPARPRGVAFDAGVPRAGEERGVSPAHSFLACPCRLSPVPVYSSRLQAAFVAFLGHSFGLVGRLF